MASVSDEHLRHKYNKALLSLSRVLDEKDGLLAKIEEMNTSLGILHEHYNSCLQENTQLKAELERERMQFERCLAHDRLIQKKLNNQNIKVLKDSSTSLARDTDEPLRNTYGNALLSLSRMMDENDRLIAKKEETNRSQGVLQERYNSCLQENSQLKAELECERMRFESCLAQDRLTEKKLTEENKKLKDELYEMERKLLLHDPVEHGRVLELQSKVDALNKALEEKDEEMHDTASFNENLLLKEHTSTLELARVHKELINVKKNMCVMQGILDELSKQLEEKTDEMQHMEALNKTLIVKEHMNNHELQEARKELINGLVGFSSNRCNFAIKRLGELDQKPFRDVCMKKFPGKDWGLEYGKLCSLWQEKISDSHWYPFRRIQIDDNIKEVIDENDDELKMLKDEWGEHAYEAVCIALTEMNEYNSSGRYIIPELWNFKEDRKANMKEVIQHVLKQIRVLKSQTKTLRRRG